MLLNLAQIMEDLNNLLYSGDIPNMFTVDEKLEVIESMREREQQLPKAVQTDGSGPALFALFVQR